MRRALLLTLLTVAACDATTPKRYGELRAKVISGGDQELQAGNSVSGLATNLTYRERIAQRSWSLVKEAYAADTTVDIQLVPGAVACVSEDQMDLIPLARCVTADDMGRSSYTFINLPTRVGTYCAHIYSTVGVETTQLVPACITITAGPVNANGVWIDGGFSGHAVTNLVRDKYNNGVPYRLTGDDRITIADTTVGSLGATTAVFDSSLVDMDSTGYPIFHGPLNVYGEEGVLIAHAWYGIGYGWPPGSFAEPFIEWHVYGLNAEH